MGIQLTWLLLFLVLFVGTVFLVCVFIQPSDFRMADLLAKAGKFEDSIQIYKKILMKYPSRIALHKLLGKIYMLNNQPDKALNEFEIASSAYPTDLEILKNLYSIYSYQGNKVKIISTLEKILQLRVEVSFYRNKLAEAYEWNNDLTKAIEQYEILFAENPENINYLKILIDLHRRNREYEKSIAYLNDLIELEPDNIELRKLLGSIYIEANQKENAANEFEMVLSFKPDNEPLRLRLAELYQWMRKSEKAIFHYEYLVNHHILNENYFNKLIALRKNHEPQKATKYIKILLSYHPEDIKLRESFVDLCVYVGYSEMASQQLKILIENKPEEPKYLLQLAELYKNSREPQLAKEVYEVMRNKGFHDKKAIDNLVYYYKFDKDYQKLLQLYNDLIDKNLANHKIKNDYAETLILVQKYEEAIRQYSILLKMDPQNEGYRIRLSQLYDLNNEGKGAIKIIREGFDKYGLENELYLQYAAQLYNDYNYNEESIACYEKLIKINHENLHYKKLLAGQYIQFKDIEKAIQLYHEIKEKEPKNLEVKIQLASLYWERHDIDRMTQVLNEAKESTNDGLYVDKTVARFYFDRGVLSEAIDNLQKVLEISPTDSSTMRMLGLAYAWNNNPKASKKLLEDYHKIYKNDYYTHYQLGEFYHLEGDHDRAFDEFQKSLALLENIAESKETSLVKAKIYARHGALATAEAEFNTLLSKYPDDPEIYIAYAEILLDSKNYEQSHYRLNQVLLREPKHSYASRVKSRLYYEQGDYKNAAKILMQLEQQLPNDLGLKLDLADIELASGDWYNSLKSLEKVLQKDPRNGPAKERLFYLRREQSPSISTNYKFETQSKNYFKQSSQFAYSKATSSIFNYTFSLEEEKYSSKDNDFEDESYLNIGLKLNSRHNTNLYSSFAAKAKRNREKWFLAGNSKIRWHFNPSQSITLSSTINDSWNDPFIATSFRGRLNSFKTDANLVLADRILLWNRLSYELHSINNNPFGNAFRSYFQFGYQWIKKPQFITYYQFYNLNYNFHKNVNRGLIPIPTKESSHFLGGLLNQQLAGNFYYHLGGSLGYSSTQNVLQYFGTMDLEYMVKNRLRLRAQFTYGSQNRLTNEGDNKSLSFALNYFY